MTDVFIKRGENTKEHTEKVMGRQKQRWNNASTSPATIGATRSYEEARTDSALE